MKRVLTIALLSGLVAGFSNPMAASLPMPQFTTSSGVSSDASSKHNGYRTAKRRAVKTSKAESPPILVKGGGRSLVFSPRAHRWYAIQNGRVVRSGVASGGASYCADIRRSCRTPAGSYQVIGKGGAGCRSSRYPLPRGGAPMPYCVYFHKFYAVHGSYDVPSNRNASHGCVRVYPKDAQWLNHNFLRIGDTVRVSSY